MSRFQKTLVSIAFMFAVYFTFGTFDVMGQESTLKKVGDTVTDTSKKAANKTVDATKKAAEVTADKTEDAAGKTVKTSKKVAGKTVEGTKKRICSSAQFLPNSDDGFGG